MSGEMRDIENVVIVGSGPAGYTAALYTSRADLHPLMIEGFAWGGLLQQTTDVENYPGYPEGVMGPQMMQEFRDQAERFGTRFITDNATRVEFGAEGEPHTVWVDDDVYRARAVILAMGAEHRKLGVPGEEELGGRGVSYCAAGDSGSLERARLRNVETGEARGLPMSGAFIAIGHMPQSEIVRGIVDTDENGYVLTEGKSTRTNVPGVFAAGDLVDHTYRQAVTAAGSGCQAALDAEWYLRDNPLVPTPAALEGRGDPAEAQWAPSTSA